MSRPLPLINFAGVLMLAGLSVAQWRANSRLHHTVSQLESTQTQLTTKLVDQEKAAKGCAADLEGFRLQLTTANTAFSETSQKQTLLEREKRTFETENESLKLALTNWMEGVEVRNKRIQELSDRHAGLVEKQNTVVSNFNELAAKYGDTVKLLNERTVRFNELVLKYNNMVKTNGATSAGK